MEADLLNSASVVVIGGAFIVMASNLVAFLLLVAMPGAPSSFLLLVVRPGAPSSILAPSRDLFMMLIAFLPCIPGDFNP